VSKGQTHSVPTMRSARDNPSAVGRSFCNVLKQKAAIHLPPKGPPNRPPCSHKNAGGRKTGSGWIGETDVQGVRTMLCRRPVAAGTELKVRQPLAHLNGIEFELLSQMWLAGAIEPG